MALKPCLDCERPSPGSRCDPHRRQREREKSRRRRLGWRDQRAVVDAYVAEVGLVCPGWGDRPPHPVASRADLTYDHLVPLAAGGDERGPGVVRCRSCNSARGARAA